MTNQMKMYSLALHCHEVAHRCVTFHVAAGFVLVDSVEEAVKVGVLLCQEKWPDFVNHHCEVLEILVDDEGDENRATELEWLRWFQSWAHFGPADGDVRDDLKRGFMKETGKNLPEGYNLAEDGETNIDMEVSE